MSEQKMMQQKMSRLTKQIFDLLDKKNSEPEIVFATLIQMGAGIATINDLTLEEFLECCRRAYMMNTFKSEKESLH